MNGLKAADLVLLGVPEPKPSVLKQIRDHHHKLAWMIAKGMRTGEIARELGMSLSRISILKSDPAFRELVEAYRKRLNDITEEEFRDVQAIRAHNKFLALQEIEDRLEEDPKSIDARTLLEIASDGEPKISKSVNLNLHQDLASGLADARRRELELSASRPPEHCRDAEAPESVGSTPAEPPTPAGEVT